MSEKKTITEKEKMTGNIELIDSLNQGIALKPEELMAISNFLIESRRAYDPAINYKNSRAPFVDRNKLFAEKLDAFIRQKAENTATQNIEKNKNFIYDKAVEQYRIKHHIKKGVVLPIDAADEINSYYVPLETKKWYNIVYKKIINNGYKSLTEDELNQLKKEVLEYKPEPTKDIDNEIYNEFSTGNIPQSDSFSVDPSELKKYLFVKNKEYKKETTKKKGDKISITSPDAYTESKQDFINLANKVKDEDHYHKGLCYRDMKYLIDKDIAKIFDLATLYPQTNNIGGYRIGDFLFNRDDFNLPYDDGGFNAWDSYNNSTFNQFNLAYEDKNKVTTNFGTSYPIGTIIYSGTANEKHFTNKQPESDKNVWPSHVTAVVAQTYDPETDTVYSLASDVAKLRLVDVPVNKKPRGIYTPNDVSVLSPKDEFKYVTFAKYFTPETIQNLKQQLELNNMSFDDFFLRPIQSKTNLEPSLNIPLTLQPRKK